MAKALILTLAAHLSVVLFFLFTGDPWAALIFMAPVYLSEWYKSFKIAIDK